MLSGHRSAWRRRRNSRAARIAVPLAIPMALGLTLGIILAVSGNNTTTVEQSALGSCASAAASAPAAAASAPAANASAPASAAASPAPCPSASGSAAASAPAVAAADNTDCDIVVPADPLSAQGLATPYQLTGPNGASPADSGCNMANAAALGAFVQATILNPRTGALSVYNPLVITGQVSFCNGISFFRTASALMAFGRVRVPAAGTSATIVPSAGRLGTGRQCPTVRNFDMVDQDQSDNVTTKYLLNPATGQTAPDTAANEANLAGAQKLGNGSDNALINNFLDPAFGCTPFTAPDLGNNNTPATSQALDELLAIRNQPRVVALIPENNPMTLDANGNLNPAKTNLYRAEVGQPAISRQNDRFDSPANYCQNMINIQGSFLTANQAVLAGGPSPVPDVGNNLFTFLANRLLQSFDNLGCKNFGLTNPVQVVTDGNGAATSATINTTLQQATGANGGGNGGGGRQGNQQSWQQIWRQFLGRGGQDNQQDGGM